MIEFKETTKRYGKHEVIHPITLTIPEGEIVSLIGASGCGKTTVLKMINRLIPLSSGDILLHGESIMDKSPVALRRQIGYVIQQTGLFPHLTIRENFELVLDLHKIPKEEWHSKIVEMMAKVGLDIKLLESYPAELSGGQQQRVGVGRALIINPEVILMDEPFSAIDPVTRSALQDELVRLQDEIRKTIVFVTHDMDEAIKISDRICILKDGQIEQYDTPENILREPATTYVEGFIGKNRIWNSPEFIKARDIMLEATNICFPNDSLVRCMKKIKDQPQDYLIVVDPVTHVFTGIINANIIRSQNTLRMRVKEVMQQPNAIAKVDDSLLDVLETVKLLHRSYMIVVDDNKRLAGIITQSSLVATLGKQYTDEEGGVV